MTQSRDSFKIVSADYQEWNKTMNHHYHLSATERESITDAVNGMLVYFYGLMLYENDAKMKTQIV